MEKRTFTRIALGLGLAEISVFVTGFLLSLIVRMFAPYNAIAAVFLYQLDYLFMYGGMIGALLIFVARLPNAPPAPQQNLSAPMFIALFLICLGFGNLLAQIGNVVDSVMDSVVYTFLDSLFGPFEEVVPADLSKYEIIAGALASCVMAPIFEELMFRKILLDKLRPFGDVTAILCCGITFGLFHLNFTQFALASAIGMLLSYVMLRTNNIYYVILLHFVYNFTQTLPSLMYLSPSISEALISIFYWVVMIVSIILGLVLFLTNLKRIELHRAPFRFSRKVNGALILGNVGSILYLVLCGVLFLYHSMSRVLP